MAFLIALLLPSSSEGFFLEYPKKAIWEYLQSWKEKKEAKKKPPAPNVKHYHVHYYPTRINVISAVAAKAPDKYELDTIHDEKLASLGWSDHEYKYAPEPRVHSFWNDMKSYLPSWTPGYIETDFTGTLDHSEHEGILLQLPVHPQIIIGHPRPSKKTSLLATFYHKLDSSK